MPKETSNQGKSYWEVEDRTAIAFSLNDSPGVLMKALQIFTDNNINMTRIQSKPSRYVKDKRLYEFYADFDGTQRDPQVIKAIE
jgi:prephenate dehydratase